MFKMQYFNYFISMSLVTQMHSDKKNCNLTIAINLLLKVFTFLQQKYKIITGSNTLEFLYL